MVTSTFARAACAAALILPALLPAGVHAEPPGAAPAPALSVTPGFHAQVSAAPAPGAALTGKVRLEVRGSGLQNVELLPASGYAPRYGVFNISPERNFAWLDLDTRLLPAPSAAVRISAFDRPAGQAGAVEIVAMPARTWSISNPPPATGGFVAVTDAAPGDNAVVRGITRITVRGNRLANVELLPATGYLPRLGVFNVSADGSTAWLDFDTRGLPDGVRGVRVSAFSMLPGQPGAAEAVAMSPRRWDFRNGATSAFSVSAVQAPLHGEILSGVVRFEIRGTGIRNAELLPPTGYLPRIAYFNVSRDGTMAWLDLHTSALPTGAFSARVSVFSTAGEQAGAKEIVAMPARQFTIVR